MTPSQVPLQEVVVAVLVKPHAPETQSVSEKQTPPTATVPVNAVVQEVGAVSIGKAAHASLATASRQSPNALPSNLILPELMSATVCSASRKVVAVQVVASGNSPQRTDSAQSAATVFAPMSATATVPLELPQAGRRKGTRRTIQVRRMMVIAADAIDIAERYKARASVCPRFTTLARGRGSTALPRFTLLA